MKGKEDVLMHQANSKVVMGYAATYLPCKNRDHDVDGIRPIAQLVAYSHRPIPNQFAG